MRVENKNPAHQRTYVHWSSLQSNISPLYLSVIFNLLTSTSDDSIELQCPLGCTLEGDPRGHVVVTRGDIEGGSFVFEHTVSECGLDSGADILHIVS